MVEEICFDCSAVAVDLLIHSRTYPVTVWIAQLTIHSHSHTHKTLTHSLPPSFPLPPVANWEDCEIVINKWKTRGTSVEQCIWEHSPHIQHGRVDPERYFGTLQAFLEKHQIIRKQS